LEKNFCKFIENKNSIKIEAEKNYYKFFYLNVNNGIYFINDNLIFDNYFIFDKIVNFDKIFIEFNFKGNLFNEFKKNLFDNLINKCKLDVFFNFLY